MGALAALVVTREEFGALVDLYLPIAVAVFVLVVLALTYVVLRFRHRDGRPVSGRIEAPRAEAAYVLVIAAVVAVLLAVTFRRETRVDALAASPALRISATGSNWRWTFDYPQEKISGAGADLYVPAGETVEFDLTSLDVIHAFYIPAEHFQRAAIPQVVNRFDLVFPTAGVQESGSCNEYCGIGHTQMRFTVHVLTPARFAAWVAQRRGAGG